MAPQVSKQKVKAVAEDLRFLLTPLPSAVWLEHLIGRCSSQVGESHVLVTSVTEEGEFWNEKKKDPKRSRGRESHLEKGTRTDQESAK